MAKKRKNGRPTKFKKAFYEQTIKLCMLGATEKELADFFHVSTTTVSNWKLADPKFVEALKQGKDIADSNVANSLYRRATGCVLPDTHFSSYEGVVTATPYMKTFPPDPTSCIFWLKNRRKQDWRDIDTRGALPVNPVSDDDVRELARRVAFLLVMGEKANQKQPESMQ